MLMTINEIVQRLQEGDLTLAFDTNITAYRGFIKLCQQVNRINIKRKVGGNVKQINLCIPAVVHTESLLHLGQRHGMAYNKVCHSRTLLSGMTGDFSLGADLAKANLFWWSKASLQQVQDTASDAVGRGLRN